MISIKRDHSVDYFKGLLVIGMVYTHVLQFFSDVSLFPSIHYSTQFFNLITFSGFVFCFGYVCQLAYYSKPFSMVYKKMFLTGLKTLLAFYISGLAFQVFVGNQPLNIETIMPIVLLQVIPGWSEFLVSFSLIILIGLGLFPILVWISNRPITFWVITLLLLATTWIDYSQITSTYMGLLIGTAHFPTFPVLQYLPFYLIGIYFAKYQIGLKWKYLLVSSLGTILFIYYLVTTDSQLPGRFPPSIYWIVGPTFFLYIYYIFSKWLDRFGKGIGIFKVMGENVLFYLLISNVFIFSLDSALSLYVVGPWTGLFFTICLLLVITYFINIMTVRVRK
ncbi:acyltransferase family protein [Aquibacillus albus]|nr:acyltransferase family protein [Aquibacillus albus]